jgi:hypothetical protein
MDASSLIHIIKGGETSRVQFKKDITNAHSAAQEMVAFANTDQRFIHAPGLRRSFCLQSSKCSSEVPVMAFVLTVPITSLPLTSSPLLRVVEERLE